MEEKVAKDDAKWDEVMEHLDLLFARVGDIDQHQHKMEARFDLSSKVIQQMLRDQQIMAKQIDLTLQQTRQWPDPPPNPTSSETSEDIPRHQNPFTFAPAGRWGRGPPEPERFRQEERQQNRTFMPKMTFLEFDGTDPCL